MYALYMTKIVDAKCQMTEDRKAIPNPDKAEIKKKWKIFLLKMYTLH
jgi:hypothetical protein